MDSDSFRALFTPEDLAEIAQAHGEIVAEDPEAAIARQNAEWSADPRLAWRQALSTACVLEGVTYHWDLEAGRSAFVLPGATPIHVPDGYLDALMAQGSNPHAVACVMKATSIDPRFRGWADEEDE
jgi:hypothetical protein